MVSCALCSPNPDLVVAEGEHWRLVLNVNQKFLGQCFWALRRHVEPVPEISSAEWMELHGLLGRTKATLDCLFQPDHYNYAFMQNQDRHVHMHVVPRYASTRAFEEMTFADPDWPGHYNGLNSAVPLSPEPLSELVAEMRRTWNSLTEYPIS